MLACPQVVDVTKPSANIVNKAGAAADPACRYRQEFSALYQADFKCKNLQAQLQQQYLKVKPGAAAATDFALFPCGMTAKSLKDSSGAKRVGTVTLPTQQVCTGTKSLIMDHAQFQRMHMGLVQ